MFQDRNGANSGTLVTSIFWELSAVTSAISALLQNGFTDEDIQAVGVLEGTVSACGEFLSTIGLPRDLIRLYSSCFEDGAILLMIRVERPTGQKAAIRLLHRFGAVSAIASNSHYQPKVLLADDRESQESRGGL